MWKALLPLSLLLLACNSTESPEMKKISLNLRETCKTDRKHYALSEPPNSWDAYVTYPGGKLKVPVLVDLVGFVLPCDWTTSGDTKNILTIIYD